MRTFVAGLIGALALTVAGSAAFAAPIRTHGGLVEGVAQDGVTVYRGVPFAAAPVGDLRWRPPAAATPWTGVRKADAFAPACSQTPLVNRLIGATAMPVSEDCLYLNVWTPAKASAERLPVMVWIYGGGFSIGATSMSAYDGASLAQKGVIVVSIAYRLGPFGFLAHPELSAESGHGSGNYGLLDQIAGLQWVKDNIAAFGGDPGRVTIFGESAGGIAVSMLAASPKAKGLFQRAISESGGSFASPRSGSEGGENVPTLAAAEQKGASFLAGLGAKSIADARRLPAESVLKAAGPGLGSGFWPVADGYVLPGDQFLLYQAGRFNDTPVLIGTNADEGALFIPAMSPARFVASVRGPYGDKADAILAAYPAGSDAEALRSARDLMRDTGFGWQTWAWARLQSQKGKGKAYVYYFAHRPPYPDTPQTKDWGAAHGAEINYVFGFPVNQVWSDTDRAVSQAVQTYWTNFAKTGDPNGGAMPAWPAYDDKRPQVMRFGDTPQAADYPNLDKLNVLEGYYAWRRSQAHAGP